MLDFEKKLDQIANIIHAGLALWVYEQHGLPDDLGASLLESVDEDGVQIPRPRPALEIGDAFVVDGDDGDFIRRRAFGRANAPVVKRAFQATEGTTERHARQRRS